jgi:hypothetical protein
VHACTNKDNASLDDLEKGHQAGSSGRGPRLGLLIGNFGWVLPRQAKDWVSVRHGRLPWCHISRPEIGQETIYDPVGHGDAEIAAGPS